MTSPTATASARNAITRILPDIRDPSLSLAEGRALHLESGALPWTGPSLKQRSGRRERANLAEKPFRPFAGMTRIRFEGFGLGQGHLSSVRSTPRNGNE